MTQFKAGDVVYLTSGSRSVGLALVMIERVTKTQAIDSRGVKYNQLSGGRIPRGDWGTPGISQRTEQLDKRFFQDLLHQSARAIRFEADHIFKDDDILARVARIRAAVARFEAMSTLPPERRDRFIADAFDAVRHKA